MSFGRMNTPIEICEEKITVDAVGVPTRTMVTVANRRAYREERHGSTLWASVAAYSTASRMYRFRVIPELEVTTRHFIRDNDAVYNITSVIELRQRYVEVLASEIEMEVK